MSIRNAVLATAACALLAWSPADVSADDHGNDASAKSCANWKESGNRPAGIEKRVERRGELPPGIQRWMDRHNPAPEAEPQPEPEPEPETPDEGTQTPDDFCTLFGCDSGASTGGLPGM
jgi:hypothetical protein